LIAVRSKNTPGELGKPEPASVGFLLTYFADLERPLVAESGPSKQWISSILNDRF
jgi:hypothetical protein